MTVNELIRKLQKLSVTGNEEVALTIENSRDDVVATSEYSVTLGKWNELGEVLDYDDENGDIVVLIG